MVVSGEEVCLLCFGLSTLQLPSVDNPAILRSLSDIMAASGSCKSLVMSFCPVILPLWHYCKPLKWSGICLYTIANVSCLKSVSAVSPNQSTQRKTFPWVDSLFLIYCTKGSYVHSTVLVHCSPTASFTDICICTVRTVKQRMHSWIKYIM